METVWIPTGGGGFNTITQIGFSWAWGGSTCNNNIGDLDDLNDNNFGGYGLCCLFDAPLDEYKFCEMGHTMSSSVCKGKIWNEYSDMPILVIDNANEYEKINFKFDTYPFRISYGSADDLTADGIKYEISFEKRDSVIYMFVRNGPAGLKEEQVIFDAPEESFLNLIGSEGFTVQINQGAIVVYLSDMLNIRALKFSDDQIDPAELTHMYVSKNKRDYFKPGPYHTEVELYMQKKFPRPVTDRLVKLRSNFHRVLTEFPRSTGAQQQKFGAKYDSMFDKILEVHRRQNERCSYPDTWKEEEEEVDEDNNDRMVIGDPCFALRQLSKGVQRWTNTFTYNCRRDNSDFADRMWTSIKRLRDRISKKYEC